MRCVKCGEELPAGARFCPSCGESVADDIPAPRKLEEPISPLERGAVPMVPLAPPPRAVVMAPRPPRPAAGRAGQSSRTASTRPAAARPSSVPESAPETLRESASSWAADADARAEDAVREMEDAESTAALDRSRLDGEAAPVRAEAPEASFSPRADGDAREPFGALERLGEKISSPGHAHKIAFGACVAAGVVVVAVLVGVSLSWFGPFAGTLGRDEAPQFEEPSDGSIEPIQQQGEDEEADSGDELPAGAPEARSAVEDYSWAELSQISALIADASSDAEAQSIAEKYKILDADGTLDGTQTKKLELTDGTTVQMRVAGIRQDTKSDGSGQAGITFVAADSIGSHAMGDNALVSEGWEGSSLRAWLNDDVLRLLPDDLADLVVEVDKTTNLGGAASGEDAQVTSDALWVPSFSEVAGMPDASNKRYGIYESEGEQYQLFSDSGVVWSEASDLLAEGDYWWLRSPDVASETWFMCVTPDGQASYNVRPATENQVIVGFCL